MTGWGREQLTNKALLARIRAAGALSGRYEQNKQLNTQKRSGWARISVVIITTSTEKDTLYVACPKCCKNYNDISFTQKNDKKTTKT
jgi:hypothetical protein